MNIDGYKLDKRVGRVFQLIACAYILSQIGNWLGHIPKEVCLALGYLFSVVIALAISPTLNIWVKQPCKVKGEN